MKSGRSLNLMSSLFRAGLVLSLIVAIHSPAGALAADVTISQNGNAQSTDDGQGNFPPIDVTFPQEFGGTPSVTLTWPYSPIHHHGWGGSLPLTATNVTSTGFRAVIGQSANRSGSPVGVKVNWTAIGPALQRVTVVPSYMVLTVIYAPPGTNGGHSTSAVSYQSGSTAGTLTSSSQTFKDGIAVSIEASGGVLFAGGGAGISFDSSTSTTDSQSVNITKSVAATISQVGPSQDGINHDEDEIWVLLKPTINVAVSSSTTEWMLANTNCPIQYVHVGWLNGHEPMPPGVASALASAGITPPVYQDILARDPLSSSQAALNSSRFVSINTTFPYEPPLSATDPVPTSTYAISNNQVTTLGTAYEDSFKVEMSVSGSAGLPLFNLKLKDTASWEWTNKSSSTTSAGSSQSAQLTIGGPSYGFTGPSVIQVYYDTVYRTFAFALVSVDTPDIALTGTLLTSKGVPAAHKAVTLIESGNKHLTYTNAKGGFTFLGQINGKVIVRAPGITQTIPRVQSTRSITLHP